MLTAENGPQVTSRIFALKNADPEEWRDKTEVATTHTFSREAAEWLGLPKSS